MVDPNWGMLQPVDIGARFQQGVDAGRQRRIENETDNALRAYAQNPDDPDAINSLLRFNPRLGMELRNQDAERRQRAQSRVDTGGALSGDMAAFTRLAQTDPEQWARIRPQVDQTNRTIGDVAMASTTPEQWDANVTRLIEQYGEGFRRYLGRFDLRDVAIAQSGQMREWLGSQEPRIFSVAPGGAVAGMNRDGTGLGYLVGGPEGAPAFTPPQPSVPGMVAAPAQPAAAPLTEAEAAPILQNAVTSKIISPADAQRLISALGPNGEASFRQWAQANGVTVGDAATPQLTLDDIDAELRRRGITP